MTHRSLLVLGASGGVGREVLAQGLEAGHSITAVTRSRPALTPFWKYVMFGLLLREGYADHHE
jgi:uncharacterized protein YbjT (DUF2867 family)